MGAGASSQYAMAAANEECTRPYDGSDITDLNAARNEVARLRQTIQRARNQQLTPVMLDLTGDGVPNARGYDTTGDGFVDSLDSKCARARAARRRRRAPRRHRARS